ncbi:MAG: hypothetical protein O2960_03280 [Verrucomicrobia bacterium]|nr:hypothetical protein [Verrucomicrobiota bacterium]
MTSDHPSNNVVKRKILAAFGGAPYPGEDNLVADQSGFDPECTEVASAFGGQKWQDVSIDLVRRFKEALPLFTPEAFAYYLPAYMVACADDYRGVDVAVDSVIFNLTPPEPRSGWQWDFFLARAGRFAVAEADAIVSFLELIQRYEIEDWAHEGKSPPPERLQHPLDFWSQSVSTQSRRT